MKKIAQKCTPTLKFVNLSNFENAGNLFFWIHSGFFYYLMYIILSSCIFEA